jgi:F0F1-type ATP synthase assembly protein I
MMVDLVVAMLTWGGIGWLADRWLDTGPWLMSIGFIVGNGAGIYLLWLRTSPAAPDRAAQPDAAAEPGHRGQRASADTGADTSLSLDEPPAGGHPA